MKNNASCRSRKKSSTVMYKRRLTCKLQSDADHLTRISWIAFYLRIQPITYRTSTAFIKIPLSLNELQQLKISTVLIGNRTLI